ncbi:MAG: methylmalonyl Co-A mutase-associated GTPase MeaB [Thermoanaerobaculia bacterium]
MSPAPAASAPFASAREVGRSISRIERGGSDVAELVREIYPRTGRARILGITGPPGAGKSTLVSRLAGAFRAAGERVGIVAVDPSSPFSGGAVLGDRIRMGELFTDPDVFIRSMATRGALGGLSRATIDAVDVLDAAGFDVVMIETVGVGQDEVDIVRAADSIAVVVVPGLGDDVQALKAGILEIADLFVVNKADREGADRTAAELSMSLDLAAASAGWRPPIVRTVATRGEGIDLVRDGLVEHGKYLKATGEDRTRRRKRAASRLRGLLEAKFFEEVESDRSRPDGFEEAIDRVAERRTDPYSAAEKLFRRFKDG